MKYILRKAQIDDAKSIATVHINTWKWVYRGEIPADYLNSLSIRKRSKRWEKWLANLEVTSNVYVSVIENKIVGFCHVGESLDPDIENHTGELLSIYIDKECTNKGIGTALMTKGLDFLSQQGFKKACLWVLISNRKAIDFYMKHGWIADGKTKIVKKSVFDITEARYAINL